MAGLASGARCGNVPRKLVREDRYLIRDFDGTLALRPGEWTGTLCEALSSRHPDRQVDPEHIRPHMRAGFPWHSPESVREPCSADEWWQRLVPVFEAAFIAGTDLDEPAARALARQIRSLYTEPGRWQVFQDTVPVLEDLARPGWRHPMLSNHSPELAHPLCRSSPAVIRTAGGVAFAPSHFLQRLYEPGLESHSGSTP
jgi:hypothetical protein